MKKCSKCGIEKELTEFSKNMKNKDKHCIRCKACDKEYYNKNNERNKEYYERNKDKAKEYQKEYRERNKDKKKEYRERNKDKAKEYQKEYRERNKDKAKTYRVKNKDKKKEYRERNKDKAKEYQKEYLNKNPLARFKQNLRVMVGQGFKLYSENGKTKACAEYGIDFEAIYNHVGPKPEGNYHLDHIIALSKFNLDNPEHVRLAHLPQNLQWLTSEDNQSKNDNIDWTLIYSSLVLFYIAHSIGLHLPKQIRRFGDFD